VRAGGAARVKLLAIETATDACSVALHADGQCFARHVVAPRRHTELVIGMLDAVCAAAGVTPAALDAVAYGHGPGTFTGVRVAATLAQGIALARDLPVLAISTLATLAEGGRRRGHRGRIVAALDARRGEVYTATFDATPTGLMRLGPDSLLAPEDLLVPDGDDWLAVGNAWDVHGARLPARLGALPRDAEHLPAARDLVTLALSAAAAGGGRRAEDALPLYLRGALD